MNPDKNVAFFRANAWMYLVLTFGWSWTVWLVAIKLQAPEAFLNLGAAGPVFAAMLLSCRGSDRKGSLLRRGAFFFLLLLICWMVLTLRYAAPPSLGFPLNAWFIVIAAPPAWVLSGVFSRDSGSRSLMERLVHSPTRWSVIAFFFFPSLLLVPALVAKLLHFPLVEPQHGGTTKSLINAGVVSLLYNLLFVAVLEEPGWRGFLLDRLQETRSPLVASIAVWAPWALWHLPLDYSRPTPFSLVMFLQVRVVFLIPIAIIMTWLYNRSRRSVQTTAIFHAGMNVFPFVLPYFRPGLALLFVVAGYAIFADRMWHKKAGAKQFPVLAEAAT